MKKKSLLAALVAGSILLLGGCGDKKEETITPSASASSKPQKLIIGATPEPHATILNRLIDPLKEKGIELEVKEFTDYVTPNMALEDGSLDANFFQHLPYLEQFNKEKKTNLVSVGNVHLEPMGIYSSKIARLANLQEGDSVAIPNDPTNGSRALKILEEQGLIKLADKPLLSALDVVENPKKLQFKELDAPQLTKVLDEVGIAVINTNYALMANLNPLKNALALESKESPYANIIAVKKGHEEDERIKTLMQVIQSEAMKVFILDKYDGSILPAF